MAMSFGIFSSTLHCDIGDHRNINMIGVKEHFLLNLLHLTNLFQ